MSCQHTGYNKEPQRASRCVVSERPNSSLTQWLQAIEAGDSVKPSQVKTDQGHLMKATSTSSKSNKNPSSSNPTIERVGAQDIFENYFC